MTPLTPLARLCRQLMRYAADHGGAMPESLTMPAASWDEVWRETEDQQLRPEVRAVAAQRGASMVVMGVPIYRGA